MTKHYRLLVKLNRQQVQNYRTFHNTLSIVENTVKKVQNKFFIVQNVAVKKYNIIREKVNNQTNIIQDLNAKALKENTPLPKKIVKWWQWYQQLTGMDKVEAAKHQVIILQDKLFECQDNGRALNKEMTDITYKLREIYAELIQTKRDDPKYVQLTIVENKCLQEQSKLMNQRILFDKEEKDNFIQLATAIKEYHDSQHINAQKYKYLSIIASALITIVSLTASLIYNNKKIVDVRNIVGEAQEKNESLLNANINQMSDLSKMFHAFDTKFTQHIANNTETKVNNKNNQSNIFMTSVNHTSRLLISGVSYTNKGISSFGSYITKIFY